MSPPITIEDYDPLWPVRFEMLRAPIAAALGPLAAAIEHVGSTAVPGLAAKPIIDIDVLLTCSADLAGAVTALAPLGYRHEGDLGIVGPESFRPLPDTFPHHLYVCLPHSAEFHRHLTFRDHLRAHAQDASAYALLKRQLAAKFATDRAAYTQAKTNFITEISAERVPSRWNICRVLHVLSFSK